MTASSASQQAYLARLTPPGAGAIAVLALYGTRAWELLEELFQPVGGDQNQEFIDRIRRRATPGKFWLGKIGDQQQGGMDQVVLSLKETAPVPLFEIQCHGGMQVVALIEEVFAARNVKVCSWQELHRRVTNNSLQTAARQALSEAVTTRTATILLEQYHGAFGRAIHTVIAALQQGKTEQATNQLNELARWVSLGKHLTTPWKIAVAGAPNVGKSSLINRLAGYERCIVSETPGTTRDAVTTRIAVDGWPVELTDTAGVRDEGLSLEKQGIDLGLTAAAEADLCLWLLDASNSPVRTSKETPKLRYVINKIDLPAAWDLNSISECRRISAKTGEGFDDLLAALSRWLVPETPPANTAIPFTSPWCEVVAEALTACRQNKWQDCLSLLYNAFGNSKE